jgi:hypothetical protein
VNLFILLSSRLPRVDKSARFLTHAALRLTCNHAGYLALWKEQVGDNWREPKPDRTWPVVASDDERWAVRATIDAVVAQAYGLSREQYAHMLSTFSHRSHPQAPDLCLQRFDELMAIGLEAFTRKHDPYWDIPLNENPPRPVIELPILAGEGPREPQGDLYSADQEGVPLRRVAEAAPDYGRARGRAGQGNSRGAGRARRR